jgi:MFS superfamily sulfate permease-like transporter
MTFEEVLYGLLIAVLASLVALIMRTRLPQLSELSRLPGTLQFRSLKLHSDSRRTTDLFILRPDETIFFANAASIREGIRDMVEEADRPVRTVLLDLELTPELDVPGVDVLRELHRELDGIGVTLLLAGAHGPVEDLLDRSGVLETMDRESLFTDVAQAVLTFDRRHTAPLHTADRGAIVSRIEQLIQTAAAHAGELTDAEKARLAETAAALDAVARSDDEKN